MKRNCRSGRVPSSSATKAEDGGDAERQSFFPPRSAEWRAGTTSDKGLVGAVRGPSAFLRRYRVFTAKNTKGKMNAAI